MFTLEEAAEAIRALGRAGVKAAECGRDLSRSISRVASAVSLHRSIREDLESFRPRPLPPPRLSTEIAPGTVSATIPYYAGRVAKGEILILEPDGTPSKIINIKEEKKEEKRYEDPEGLERMIRED
jgi:hypothetical protein